MIRLMKEDDSILNLVALGCCGAFVYVVAVCIQEVEVTTINVTSTSNFSSGDDNDHDIKKAMYSIVLHVVYDKIKTTTTSYLGCISGISVKGLFSFLNISSAVSSSNTSSRTL